MPPINYGWLQRATGEVLQRTIPKGVNWGALPGQFLNTLDDIYRMAPGASREAARSQAKRTLQRSAATPPARPTGTMGPSGQFRAPSVGAPGPARAPGVSVPRQTSVGRGPYAVDYGLRRQAMGDVRNANLLRGAAGLGGTARLVGAGLGLTPVGIGINEAINLAFPPEAKGGLPIGTRGADGKFWTGDDYGWQSGASAVKAGLLPSEVVGSTATGRAFGADRPTGGREQTGTGAGSLSTQQAPPAPVLPPAPGASPSTLTTPLSSVETPLTRRPPAPVQSGPQVPGTTAGNAAAVTPPSPGAPGLSRTSAITGLTPEGQFQRYMQGSEMNRYFGGPASAQAPKDAAAMQETAMLQQAPTTMPLADYYRSQSATGRANMDDIIGLMGYEGDMAKWARANPMLAQRAYAQQFQGGVPTQGAPGAVPAVDAALDPAGPEFRGVGGDGERIYNFAADDMTPEKIKAFQELLKKQSAQ